MAQLRKRSIVVDGVSYRWSVRHFHESLGDGRTEGCQTVLSFSTPGANRKAVFRAGDDGTGFAFGSTVQLAVGGPLVNLNLPSVVARVIRAVLADGDSAGRDLDGWALLTWIEVSA
jgi:hypothetical protein